MNPRTRSLILVAVALILLGVMVVLVISLPDYTRPQLLYQPKPLPEGTQPFMTTAVETAPPASGTSPVIQGPPAFRLLVTPVEARARPGDTIVYSLTIEPEGGFDEPVSLRLDVRALFLYQESFSLGTIDPPFPKTVDYQFVVPSDIPAGITVSGVLTAEGGEYRDSVPLILVIS